MATFSLNDRHKREAETSARNLARITTETTTTTNNPPPKNAGGDHRYRIPTIGLNAGAIPGSRPDIQVSTS